MKTKIMSSFIATYLIGTASMVCGADLSLNSRDQHFVRDFSNVSLEAQHIGQLAQRQSQDTQVKELGQKLLRDYAQAGQLMASTAQSAGAGETSQMSGTAVREINRLAGLSGAAFDQAAVRELFRCQESGVRQLDLEAGNGGNLALRQLAELLRTATEPDVWQTAQLSAQLNGHP